MRTLTKREQNLAVIFGVAIFAAANLLAVSALLRKQTEFRSHLQTLRLERIHADGLLADKDTWLQRKQWLDNNQPRLKSTGEANAALQESLTSSAAQHSITIVDQAFAEPDNAHKTSYHEIAVKLKVSGSLEAITRWLVEIQQPAKFQAVPALSMKIDSDPAKVVCELTVSRYYAPAQ